MGRLDGKVAVITGGSSGIGEATVRLFVKEGAKVLLFARNEERSNGIIADLGKNVQFFQGDVTVENDVKKAVDTAVETWGKLDCMYNNAGSGVESGPIDTLSESGFDRTVDVLLKGVFFGVKHAARVMKPQGYGSIVNCSSVNGLLVTGRNLFYSTCKAAVDHLTRLAASELGPYGIRVNSVVPGAILTPIWYGNTELTDEMKKDYGYYFKKYQPLKLLGMPIDIANAVLWLASDEARFVSGHPLVIDGGISIGFPGVTINEMNEEGAKVYNKHCNP